HAAAIHELDGAVGEREQRVVLAAADVASCLDRRPALSDDDRSTGNDLAVEALHAEALRVRVATVPGTSARFLMSHRRLLPRRPESGLDRLDLYRRVVLAMTATPPAGVLT